MPSLVDLTAAFAVGIGNAVLGPVRPEPGPATQRWGVGVGEVAASVPKMPGLVREIARQLNQFGSVVVSPGGIEFDGDEVAWSKVTEIRARRLVGYLVTDAIAKQVDRFPLWRFPGRGLVLSGLTHAALTAVAVAADLKLDRGVFTVYIPAEVHYQGLLRAKDIQPGVPAALVLADPAVRDLVEETARAHGIPVLMAEDDALEVAAQRAAAIRSFVGGIGALVGLT
ncbi:MAG: hypothetical protein ACOYBX_02660 [Mycobacterium sp.]|jgi:hypothetical protein